jgi:hypothetical protein
MIRYLYAGIVLVAFGAGWLGNGWRLNADIADQRLTIANQAETLRLASQHKINQTATKFAEKAAKDRVVTQTIIREVEKYVPSTAPVLSGDFRVFHDAAAAGQEIDDTKRANAAPVKAQTVAATVADNYSACLYDQQRLTALQDIVRTINGE